MSEDYWLGEKIGKALAGRVGELEAKMIYGVSISPPLNPTFKWTATTRPMTDFETIQRLRTQVTELKSALREEQEAADETDAENAELDAENTQLANDKIALTNRVRDLERQADRGAGTINALLSEKSSKDSVLDSYRVSCCDLQKRNDKQKTMIEQLVARLDRVFLNYGSPTAIHGSTLNDYLPGGRYA